MFNGWSFETIHRFYKNENWAHSQPYVLLRVPLSFSIRPIDFQEPNNLKNRNSFRFNGLVHPKVVGVQAATDGKGVVFSTGSVKSKHFILLVVHFISQWNLICRPTKTTQTLS